jgi:hypothetical protein
LYTVLTEHNRWTPGQPVQLRTPPIARDNRDAREPAGVDVRIFPTWFTCEEVAEPDAPLQRRRRLVRWTELDVADGRKKFQRQDGKKVDVTPIRFVGACKKGHLQDLDWKWLLHRGEKCSEPMWIEEEGTSADPANIRIGCLCSRAPLSLADAFKPGFLGRCKGERPWLDSPEEGCTELLHFLARSATNTYFPQSVTIISLPIYEDALSTAIRKQWSALQPATDSTFMKVLRNVAEIGASLAAFSDEDVYARIVQMRESVQLEAAQDPKIAEFDLLGSGAVTIGADDRKQPLFAETLVGLALDQPATRNGIPFLESIVALHRLRAVTCLYGFTRLEPSPTIAEALLEDVRLAVDGAPLAEAADWLPAMEQFGEGIFIKNRSDAIRGWISHDGVRKRGDTLVQGVSRYSSRYGLKQPYPGLPYVALHSLSHALMQEIALDCGYPLSSLKERIYSVPGTAGAPDRFGILVYTASAGAQGTLGGLTEAAKRVPQLLSTALDRLGLCSNDPVCADHDPSVSGDERGLHGAACHACLLVPETTCEARNTLLDRALLVETIAGTDAALFVRDGQSDAKEP